MPNKTLSKDELLFLRLFASGFATGGMISHMIPIDKSAVEYARLCGVYQDHLNQELKKYHAYDLSQLNQRDPGFMREHIYSLIREKSQAIHDLIPSPADGSGEKFTVRRKDSDAIHTLYQWYLHKYGTANAQRNENVILFDFDESDLLQLKEPLLDLSSLEAKLEALKIVEREIALQGEYQYFIEVKTVAEACEMITDEEGFENVSVNSLKKKIENQFHILGEEKLKTTRTHRIRSWYERKTEEYNILKRIEKNA